MMTNSPKNKTLLGYDNSLKFKFTKEYKHLNPYDYYGIFLGPKWYLVLEKELKEFFWDYKGSRSKKSKEWLEEREEFLSMVSELLSAGVIYVEKDGLNHDEGREEIDTVVIHHSSREFKGNKDETYNELNALGLIRLYAANYAKKSKSYHGMPIWSNHGYGGKQTFIAYHFLVYPDGTFDQILNEQCIGWHAGDWKVNKRSIAICFVGDLENKRPTDEAIKAAKTIVARYSIKEVLGHHEVNTKTSCPGKPFLGDKGWKRELFH